VADFASGEIDYILDEVARAWYVPTGHIVYVRADGAVFATAFDLKTRTLAAGGTPLFDGVRTGSGWADMVVGDDGTMVYVAGANGQGDVENLVWVDADGVVVPVDAGWASQNLDAPALSPDETRIAVPILDDAGGGADLWVKELPAGPLTRLTRGGGTPFHPKWTPDGRSVVYSVDTPNGGTEVRRIRADGSQPEAEVLFAPEVEDVAGVGDIDMGPEGRGFLFRTGSAPDIGYWDPEADSVAWLLTSDFAELAPALSPDGRWMAYTSNVAGDLEVFVRPFPDVMESRTQVSIGGGTEPVWSRDSDELYYRTSEELVVASFTADTTFRVDARTQLFPMGLRYVGRPGSRSYDVGRSGRFLLVQNAEAVEGDESAGATMVLVQNWFEELKSLLGGRD
jgi:hypothetical protein